MRACGVLTVLLTVLLATNPEAYAASHVMKDTRQDTYAPSDQDSSHLVLKPRANGDITSVRTTHGTKAVNVTIRARELRHARLAMIDILTSAEHHRRFVLTAGAVGGQKIISLTRGFNREIDCRGLRVRLDADLGTIKAHVPRRCINDPRWVRTGVMLMTIDKQTGAPSTIDVAGRTVLTDRWWNDPTLRVPHSPRVHVG